MAQSPKFVEAISLARQGRVREGLALLAEAGEEGDPQALFSLAELYWVGGPVPQDLPLGREMMRRAAEAGHPSAISAFTNLLGSGIAGPRDWPAALGRLRSEAASDPARARALALVEAMELDEAGDPRAPPPGEALSDAPRAALHRGAFTLEECDYLRALAEPAMKPSRVGDGQGREVLRDVRTSEDSTLYWLIEDPAVHALNRRLAAISGTRPEQAEALLVLRYRPGQEYRPHVDWDSDENGRVATVLVYLNDDYDGGETLFVRTGLEVKGRTGDALVFHSAAPDGRLDPLSEHAGLPVVRGTKYLASRWIHAGRFAP